MLSTMADKLASNFPHKARAIGPETASSALDQPEESVSPPTGEHVGNRIIVLIGR